ncbi:MAG: glyoxalase superfamily protein [Acidobacteriota bacterium]
MPTFKRVTPNLVVRDIAASTAFYRDVLGFAVKTTVPDDPPHVFVWLERDGVGVFLNDRAGVADDLPSLAGREPGGTATLFFVLAGIDEYHAAVAPRAPVLLPLKTQFYGMREFAIEDPDGHVITFAEPVSA